MSECEASDKAEMERVLAETISRNIGSHPYAAPQLARQRGSIDSKGGRERGHDREAVGIAAAIPEFLAVQCSAYG